MMSKLEQLKDTLLQRQSELASIDADNQPKSLRALLIEKLEEERIQQQKDED